MQDSYSRSNKTSQHKKASSCIVYSAQGLFLSLFSKHSANLALQRFEHKAAGQKIDAPIRFPSTLNMAPYTTHSIGMEEHARKLSKCAPLVYQYDLFSVVNHDGQLNTGHYTNFARSHDEWYRFDDDKVTKARLSECLASTPYMCFYVRRQLEYKPSLPQLSTKSPPDIKPFINAPVS